MGGFNGSGVYVRYFNWQQDAANGIDITASRVDTEDDGYATGLSTCITKDGQTTITANLPMAGFRHTGVGNGVNLTDYAAVGQVQSGGLMALSSVTGTNIITGITSPVIAAYAIGQTFRFISTGTCTGAVTLNVDALGAKAILKSQSPLVAGDITSGDAVEVFYDGTSFQLLSNPRTPAAPAGGFQPNIINSIQTSLTSATTTDLGTIPSQNVLITGSTTITSFGSSASTSSPLYFLEFNGALTLTYNATSLIIPGSASITTAAGDTAIAEYSGSGNWRIRTYMPFTGRAVAGSTSTTFQYLISSGTYITPANCRAIHVEAWGAGGGGGAGATNAGSPGSNTIFNGVNAAGGSGGNQGSGTNSSAGGAGGTGGSGSASDRTTGNPGTNGSAGASGVPQVSGGMGGTTARGGAGQGGHAGAQAGGSAANNSGAGGGGAVNTGGSIGGAGGGGAGEYFQMDIASPTGSYAYTIGTGGNGGAAGTNAGGNGGSGFIQVTEYY